MQDYKQKLVNVSVQKMIFFGERLNGLNMLNVYEVINEICCAGLPVYKFRSSGRWMKYHNFKKYFRTLKLYTQLIDWYVAEYEDV